MTTEQLRALQAAEDFAKGSESSTPDLEKNAAGTANEDVFVNSNEPVLPVDQPNEEVTNNDGSIIDTLDAAFHNQPGAIKDAGTGSDRADYYEARSQGESDAEEEQDFLKKQ